jgi:hypothetical protein
MRHVTINSPFWHILDALYTTLLPLCFPVSNLISGLLPVLPDILRLPFKKPSFLFSCLIHRRQMLILVYPFLPFKRREKRRRRRRRVGEDELKGSMNLMTFFQLEEDIFPLKACVIESS